MNSAYPFWAAFLVGAAAPFVRAAFWGVPLAHFSLAMVLRSGVGAAIVTLPIALLGTVFLPEHLAGLLGAALGGLFMVLSARRQRHERGIALLCLGLDKALTATTAWTALEAKLTALEQQLPTQEYGRLLLLAIGPMTLVGRWQESAERLRKLEPGALPEGLRLRLFQAQSTIELQLGHLEASQAAIDAIDASDAAPDPIKAWSGATQALLWAIQGAADKALEAAKTDPGQDLALAAAYEVVRAHALASKGEDSAARTALERVQKAAGDAALDRAIKPTGPASDLAYALRHGG